MQINRMGFNIFNTKRTFRQEFKRQIRLAIVAAVGFTIAWAWRNAIFDFFQNLVSRFINIEQGHYLNETYSAIAATIFGVIIILITSKILQD